MYVYVGPHASHLLLVRLPPPRAAYFHRCAGNARASFREPTSVPLAPPGMQGFRSSVCSRVVFECFPYPILSI